jgi:photosystem II stability/assembly factor-like uncharacterized protein
MLYKTVDSGKNWEQVQFQQDLHFNMVDMVSSKAGWAVQDNDTLRIYKTRDGEQTWNPAYGALNRAVDGSLIYLDAIDENIAYIAGSDFIYRTVDGGDNWINTRPDSQNIVFSEIQVLNNKLAITIGIRDGSGNEREAVILSTRDGGESWEETILDELSDLYNLQFVDQSTVYFSAVKYVNTDPFYFLYCSTDSDKTWSEVSQSR